MPRWPNDESQYNTQSTFEGPQKSLILARNATARGAQKTSRLYIPNGLLNSQTSDTQWVESLQPQTAKPLFLPEALIPDPDTVNLPSSPSALSASSKENDPTPSLPMGELHAEVDWLRRLAISYRAFASLYDERADRLLAANPEKMEQQQVVRTNHAPTRPLPEANESKQLKGKGVTMPVEGRQVTVKQGKTCHGDVESMLGGGHHSNWSDK
ncbi:hypothetical protein QCA50_007493 [Cerrena zonata]|uniref:Uncharacterized protein n=1 Tax=Cerrena zonata TaxID=2478898 RepID=A0AAW0G8E8_9APHY